jgi:hypothetical protein
MTFTIILADLLDNAVIALLGVSSYFIYIIWGIGQFFGEKNIINYVKSALTFALGIFSYLSFFIGIAYLLKIFFPETPTL